MTLSGRMKMALADEIACIDREIRMRVRVYPRFVEGKRMTQAKADHEIATMTCVLERLKKIEEGERLI